MKTKREGDIAKARKQKKARKKARIEKVRIEKARDIAHTLCGALRSQNLYSCYLGTALQNV